MATFDGWEAQLYGPNTLAHFRTKGSKNGVRRFQNEDGTWTPLGLRERKEREGWGKEERRAAKKEAKAERRAAKAERKAANAAARKERIAAFKEEQRKKKLKNLTMEELQAKVDRAKLEQEYKSLTKSPYLETGMKLVKALVEHHTQKLAREETQAKRALEMARLRTEQIKAQEATKQELYKKGQEKSKADAAKQEFLRTKQDVKGGLKIKRKKELKGAQLAYRNTTIRGAFGKLLNKSFEGLGEKNATISKGKGKIAAILAQRKKVDKYNSKADPWNQMQHLPSQQDEWSHEFDMEKQKTKQKKWESRKPSKP